MTDYNQLDYPDLTDETKRLCFALNNASIWNPPPSTTTIVRHMCALQAELDKAQAQVTELELANETANHIGVFLRD